MPVTHAEFWKLLRDSRLIPASRCEEVEAASAQARAASTAWDVRSLAAWLVREQLLTRYQAEQLLRGRSGPFFYGPYRIVDRIRDGRLRGLFRACHEPTQFSVLLHFAPARVAQDPRLWNHVRQYQRGHTQLQHPHLQRVFSVEDTAGHRFLVLEDLAGDSLADALEPGSALSPADACSVVHMTALGLAALHEHRHAYGDLRPANLWLDPAGHLKLLRDFVQPPVIPDLTRGDLNESTREQLHYLAPELAHPGTRLSPTTDIYALGCAFYELLSGQPPFVGSAPAEMLQRHANETPESLESFDIPEDLAAIVEQMLAKDATQRIASAREVAERLAPFLDPPIASLVAPPTADDHLPEFEAALSHGGRVPPAPPPIVSTLPPPPVATVAPAASPPVNAAHASATTPSAATTTESAIQIEGETDQSVAARRMRRRRRSPRQRALTLGILAVVCILAATAYYLRVPAPFWRSVLGGTADSMAAQPRPSEDRQPETGSEHKDSQPDAAANTPSTGNYCATPDDGQSLWMPPTQGHPIQIAGIPPGSQLLFVLRARDLVQMAAGQLALRSLGEEVVAYRQRWEAAAGFPWEQIDQLMVCWSGDSQAALSPTYVVRLHEPVGREQMVAAWGETSTEGSGDATVYRKDSWSYGLPAGAGPGIFVMGPDATVREVLTLTSERPVLRREMAQLLATSDDQSLATVLVVPSFLHDTLTHKSWGPLSRAVPATDWLLRDDIMACRLSLHLGEMGYLELRGCGRTGADSRQLAEALRERVRELPNRIEAHFQQVYPAPYWRPIALRMPEMVRFLADYTRIGIESDQAVVNSVLPAQAIHNLLFASQMLMVASSAEDMPAPTTTSPAVTPAMPQSLDELLSRKMTFRFALQSLEFAIRDLGEAVRENYPQLPFPFDIQILGSDLQLQGITRNQQVARFEAVDQPLSEILTALVMRANPVTTVTAPSDPNQKLVWIQGLDPADPKKPILLITTREAAQRRNDTLPAAFQPK